MQSLFYHNRTGNKAYTGNLDTKAVRNAITLHPLKRPEYMYRLHAHFMELAIQEQSYDVVTLQRRLDVLNQLQSKSVLKFFRFFLYIFIQHVYLKFAHIPARNNA